MISERKAVLGLSARLDGECPFEGLTDVISPHRRIAQPHSLAVKVAAGYYHSSLLSSLNRVINATTHQYQVSMGTLSSCFVSFFD